MLVVDLGKWMNKILIDWGIDAKVADRFDETIIAILMIAIAVGVDYLCQAILVGGMRQYTRRKPHLWNTLLMKRKVFHNLIHTIPAILVYALLPMAFMRGKELLVISQKACAIYIIFSLLLAINGILLMIMDIYDGKETMKNRPMKGFIQVLQVLLFFIGGIVIISILVNKSPASLFAGGFRGKRISYGRKCNYSFLCRSSQWKLQGTSFPGKRNRDGKSNCRKDAV